MKRVMKVLSSVLLIALLAVTMVTPALAADAASVTYYGHEKGFGFEPGSTYTDTDLFSDAFKGLMPGDVATETIAVKNESSDTELVKLYMQAIPHNASNPMSPNVAAEEASVEEMNDFLAQLSMKVWNGDTLIYEASPDKTAGLTTPVLLGTYEQGEGTTLKVELIVPLTLSNEYAERVGEVDWLFIAEQTMYPRMDYVVTKIWTDKGLTPPAGVTVTLYKDGEAYDSVYLTAAKGWQHVWQVPDDGSVYTVRETVPKGYLAKYQLGTNYGIIYNTSGLIQTSQLNWPVPVLLIAGMLLMTAGLILIGKDRKEQHD